ncbi:MAG: tRNA uridine-5-carboxymethylaminomethyl(34) synthesis GTPase MnmE [Pyrinomonadaceae bacterium]
MALSTPPGRGGIGIIRISGVDALNFAQRLLLDETFAPEPHRVSLKAIHDPESLEILDRGLVTFFKSPHSFTGEDVVELSCHGSPILLTRVVDALLRLGARAADAGEFTLRALSNNRLNLTQAEAIRDLINAQTDAALQQASRQLGGELSSRLQPIKNGTIEIIIPLESSLEFVEDDLPDIAYEKIRLQLANLIRTTDALAETFSAGRLLQQGIRVTFVGKPNVGKSSIFNRLLQRERAIVTELPGTTRDSLTEQIVLGGIPLSLTDTAGIRAAGDMVERLGIERTRRAVIDADLVVVVFDGSSTFDREDQDVFQSVGERKHLVVLNKSDDEAFNCIRPGFVDDSKILSLSAKTGDGFDVLQDEMLAPFLSASNVEHNDFLITNARQYDLLRRTSHSLKLTDDLFKEKASEELLLVGLYDALKYLGQITGEVTPEEILSEIFKTFCIGK